MILNVMILGVTGMLGYSLFTNLKDYKNLNCDINALSIQELYSIVKEHPKMLRSPILVDAKRLQVGYNEMDIRRFIPRKVRAYELFEMQRLANDY